MMLKLKFDRNRKYFYIELETGELIGLNFLNSDDYIVNNPITSFVINNIAITVFNHNQYVEFVLLYNDDTKDEIVIDISGVEDFVYINNTVVKLLLPTSSFMHVNIADGIISEIINNSLVFQVNDKESRIIFSNDIYDFEEEKSLVKAASNFNEPVFRMLTLPNSSVTGAYQFVGVNSISFQPSFLTSGLVERYTFVGDDATTQLWANRVAGTALTCIRGISTGNTTNDPSLSNLGATFDGSTPEYCVPTYIYPSLVGVSAITDMYLVKPASLEAGTGRDMLADRICSGTATSGISQWFTNTGHLLVGARSQSSDTWANVSLTSANALATAGSWVLVGAEFDFTAKTIKLFQNGVYTGDLKTSAGFASNTVANNSPSAGYDVFCINAAKTTAYSFPGIMYESVTYRRVLTSDEHLQIANYYKDKLTTLGETTW